ncbi:hypothetical protein MEO40_18910, partial [Dolichospermum sp. ST_sed1]|nr:hypothetical protein [Dolichospermum sp. ST_sed1]
SKRRCFLRCVAQKKTVSLFQSHEFFLLESCPFPVPSELKQEIPFISTGNNPKQWLDRIE